MRETGIGDNLSRKANMTKLIRRKGYGYTDDF